MRTTMMAALAALLPTLGVGQPCAAVADAAGNASTRNSLGVQRAPQYKVFQFPGDVDWFRVQLVKGADYYVSARCLCDFDIRNSAGRVMAKGHANDIGEVSNGFPFRAPYRGLYFVEFADQGGSPPDLYPYGYGVTITGDCGGTDGWDTRCELAPGEERGGVLVDHLDGDAFRATLAAGSHTLTLSYAGTGSDVEADVIAPDGSDVAVSGGGAVTFTVPRDGVYLVVVGSEDSHVDHMPYSLALDAPAVARKRR